MEGFLFYVRCFRGHSTTGSNNDFLNPGGGIFQLVFTMRLELLSTVHWLARDGQTRPLDELVEETYAWNPRKRQFSPRQIGLAQHVLAEQGWLPHATP